MRDDEIEILDSNFRVLVYEFTGNKVVKLYDTRVRGGLGALRAFYWFLDTARIAVGSDLEAEEDGYVPPLVNLETRRVFKSRTLLWTPKLGKRSGISIILVEEP